MAKADTVGSSNLSWYEYIVDGFWEEYGDPLAKNIPLCDRGPWRILGIVSIYLSFVLYIGPRYMKNRPAFTLEKTIRYYDWVHVFANGFCSLLAFYVTRFTYDCWTCKKTGSLDNTFNWLNLWLGGAYFAAKFLDLFDTIFFVLRKKDRQVSVLHVVHHGVMPFAAYSALKFAPLGRTSFVGIINSMIHTVMYFYYALASYGPSMAKHLWFKKHITTLQMVQFVLIMAHSVHGYFACPDFPIGISILEFLHGFFFLRSFYNFFKQEYAIKEKIENEPNVKSNGSKSWPSSKSEPLQHLKGA